MGNKDMYCVYTICKEEYGCPKIHMSGWVHQRCNESPARCRSDNKPCGWERENKERRML